MRAWVISSVIAAVGFVVTTVRADVLREPVELNWLAPECCPNKSNFLATVTQMLGERVAIAHPLFADVVITQSNSASFQLRLTTTFAGTSGQRVLEGRSCRVVADAAAVTLALLLNPDLEVPAESKTDDLAQAKNVPPSTRDRVPAPPIHHRPDLPANVPMSPWYGLLSSQLGLQLGALPRAQRQFSLGVGVGYKRLSIGVNGSYAPPQNERLAAANLGGRLWTMTAGVQGCWLWTVQSPRFGNCIGTELTRLRGRGTGVSNPRDGVTYWLAPSLAAHADFGLNRRAWFRLAGSGRVPLARPDTHLDNYGTVQKPAKVLGRLDVGIVVSF